MKITVLLMTALTLIACKERDPVEVKAACAQSEELSLLPYLDMSLSYNVDKTFNGVAKRGCSLRYTDKKDAAWMEKLLMINIVGDNQDDIGNDPKWKEYDIHYMTLKDGLEEIEPFKSAMFTALKPIFSSKIQEIQFYDELSKKNFFDKITTERYRKEIFHVNKKYRVKITKHESPTVDGIEYVYSMNMQLI